MDKISLKAPAKINLYLDVVRKRPDGYHEVESLMQAVDLYDLISLEKSDKIELSCSDPALPRGEKNLAFRAATLFQAQYPIPGVKINLEKHIPFGAGLGGGSSDAAFVLRGLCELYDIRPAGNEMLEIAMQLGSDVPFFLTSGQAIARGRGEILEEISLPLDYSIIIIKPAVNISTAEIYANVKINLTKRRKQHLLLTKIDISRLVSLANDFHNDLENIVLSQNPKLGELKRSLLGSGAFHSSMTGSGSSFFGLFLHEAKIDDDLIRSMGQGATAFNCRPILLSSFGW